MKPKEKAFQIFWNYIHNVNADYDKAKKSAIIVVDEILLEIDDNYDSMHSSDRKLYWQEAKQELENEY